MRSIETLSKQIHGELSDAKKYIECAEKNKMENRELAELYYALSVEEVSHMDRLHSAVVNEIKKFKATGAEVPAVMQGIWDWQHAEIIDETAEVRILQELYKK